MYELCIETDSKTTDWLYENLTDLSQYCGPLDSSKITQWYTSRAREIEQRTGIVDHALKLIDIAKEKNVQVCNELLHLKNKFVILTYT